MVTTKVGLRLRPQSPKLLILIQGKQVENVPLPVDEQHPPAIHNAFQIAGQFGQLVFASQRESLCLVLYLRRQTSAAMKLAFRARG